MAFDYGTKDEPGIVSDVNSLTTVSGGTDAPNTPGIVGQADLTNGDANPNQVYEIIEDTTAVQRFGENSLLTNAVLDALNGGADVVYAVATELLNVSGEDLSGLSSHSGTLSEAPPSEDPEDITFTIGGYDLTTVIQYTDVDELSPGTEEVYVQADNGDFVIDSELTVGETGDVVKYDYPDYPTAFDTLEDDAGKVVDHVAGLNENTSVTDYALSTGESLATNHEFVMVYAGIPLNSDPTNYTNPYDTSRLAVLTPTRDYDGNSAIGSYLGKRANLGIETTPINKHLESFDTLIKDLKSEDRKRYLEERVVPLSVESGGIRITDDINTVSDDNTEEENIRFAYTRILTDYILTVIRENERPFVGRLNNPDVRNTLEGLLKNELRVLESRNQVISFDLEVVPVDATTARMRMEADLAEPLRFIENVLGIGN